MNVVWIHRGGPDMASYRYRALIPSQILGGSVNEGMADTLIFSKPQAEDIELAIRARKDGTQVITDICDDHLNHPELGPVYKDMINLSDKIVCPTKVMGERIYEEYRRDFNVIPDPYEQELCEPHAEGNNLLWFGHQSNLDDIVKYLPLLDQINRKVTIVSGPKKIKGVIPWSLKTQREELQKANIVLLPSRKGAEYKSPNRLVNSIRAGCFVVGHHPAYEESRRFVWNGEIFTGARWATINQSILNDLVKEGQSYTEKYSPENIAKQWAAIL